MIPDWRARRDRHGLTTLLAQRIDQLAFVYEDQDDVDTVRTGPLLKHVCGRLPETDPDLASYPAFSQLENAIKNLKMSCFADRLRCQRFWVTRSGCCGTRRRTGCSRH